MVSSSNYCRFKGAGPGIFYWYCEHFILAPAGLKATNKTKILFVDKKR